MIIRVFFALLASVASAFCQELETAPSRLGELINRHAVALKYAVRLSQTGCADEGNSSKPQFTCEYAGSDLNCLASAPSANEPSTSFSCAFDGDSKVTLRALVEASAISMRLFSPSATGSEREAALKALANGFQKSNSSGKVVIGGIRYMLGFSSGTEVMFIATKISP